MSGLIDSLLSWNSSFLEQHENLPHDVHFIEKGAINRTVMTFGPVWRWLFGLRVIADGAKSGGEYLERTFRSDMVALLFQRCVEISWLCMELELSMAIIGSEIDIADKVTWLDIR